MTDIAGTARIDPWPLRLMAPANTAKWTARRFGRAIETARKWLVDGVPADQRARMADVIDAELDRIEGDVASLRAFRDRCRAGEVPIEMARAEARRIAGEDCAQTHGLWER